MNISTPFSFRRLTGWHTVFALLAASAAPLAAADAPATPAAPVTMYGVDEKCRIALLQPAPRNDDVDWSGDCEGGYATGPGELEWKDADKRRYKLSATLVRGEVVGEGELTSHEGVYKGSFRHGLPHGMGFWRYKSGRMYEGELVDGIRQGQGILLTRDHTEYKGEWKDDELNGWGEASFALGGSYRGQWKDFQFHGHGTIVYAGSGHTYEGEFKEGRIAGTAPPVVEVGSFPILPERFGERQQVFGHLPPDASWEMLTEAQKEFLREQYWALEPGDEPPYPLKGTRESLTAVVKINHLANSVEGDLRMYVVVGTDGQAKSVKVYEKPKPGDSGTKIDTMVHYVSVVLMLDKYKPAKCRGKPCEMVYPVSYHFSVD